MDVSGGGLYENASFVEGEGRWNTCGERKTRDRLSVILVSFSDALFVIAALGGSGYSSSASRVSCLEEDTHPIGHVLARKHTHAHTHAVYKIIGKSSW